MSSLIEIALKAGPWLLVVLGVLFGWARHKQAQTTAAQADQKVADAERRTAQGDAINAKSNEDAARTGADNAKVRRDEDSAAAADPDPNRVLHDEWGK